MSENEEKKTDKKTILWRVVSVFLIFAVAGLGFIAYTSGEYATFIPPALAGAAGDAGWKFSPDGSTTTTIYGLDVQGGKLFVVPGTGFVGVNTTSPANQFNVVGEANFTGAAYAAGSQICTVANGLCAGTPGAGFTSLLSPDGSLILVTNAGNTTFNASLNTTFTNTRYTNRTEVCFSNGTNCPAAGSGDVTDVLAGDVSLAVTNSGGPQPSLIVNMTHMNASFFNRTEGRLDNQSWNQTHATTLYLGISATATNSLQLAGFPGSYYLNGTGFDAANLTSGTLSNARLASTVTLDAEWDTIGEVETIWGLTVCRTDGTNCPASSGNSSWNQTHANTLYVLKSDNHANVSGDVNVTGNYTNLNLQIGADTVGDLELDTSQVTLADFTNDRNFIGNNTPGNISTLTVTTTINFSSTGNVSTYSNGCRTVANSTGVYFIC